MIEICLELPDWAWWVLGIGLYLLIGLPAGRAIYRKEYKTEGMTGATYGGIIAWITWPLIIPYLFLSLGNPVENKE